MKIQQQLDEIKDNYTDLKRVAEDALQLVEDVIGDGLDANRAAVVLEDLKKELEEL